MRWYRWCRRSGSDAEPGLHGNELLAGVLAHSDAFLGLTANLIRLDPQFLNHRDERSQPAHEHFSAFGWQVMPPSGAMRRVG